MFLNLIFIAFIIMIARTAWLLHNEKSKKGGGKMIPHAVCENCGAVFYGWALSLPEHRVCECGYRLILVENE